MRRERRDERQTGRKLSFLIHISLPAVPSGSESEYFIKGNYVGYSSSTVPGIAQIPLPHSAALHEPADHYLSLISMLSGSEV